MTEERPPDLNDLDAKLKEARDRIENGGEKNRRTSYNDSLAGVGFRISIELVVGIAVGFGIGWFIDRGLGTKPWFMLGFMFLGLAAGIMNVIRLTKDLSRRMSEKD